MSTRPLSSYNICYQIQQDICDVMNQSPVILSAGLEYIPEDSQTVDYKIKESLKKQGMACVVMTPSLNYLGHNGTTQAYQMDELVVQFVEYTPINRASNREIIVTGNDLASYTSELLAGPNAVIGFGKLNTKSIEQGEDNGLLVTKLTFQTYVENGDTGPIIYVPFVSREEMEDYVGDGKLTFLKDGEEIGSFSANTKEDVEIEIPNSGVWGQITGNLEDQSDLIGRLGELGNEIADNTRDIEETNTKVTNLSSSLSSTINDVTQIKEKIPTNASSQNQLADKAFVNSSINNYAAFYLTRDASGNAFQTFSQLSNATLFFNAGTVRLPTRNDYCVVLEDETKTTSLSVHPTTRYIYQGVYPNGQWEFQYIVNNTSLTQAQVDAINSGITKNIVDTLVVPSDINSGWASNSDNAQEANHAQTSELAYNAYQANYADQAGYANEADYAYQASNASLAETAQDSVNAQNANWAQTADTADNALSANIALSVSNYSDTLLSGLTEDDTPVSFYILTKNA